jgi:hypothetical protein
MVEIGLVYASELKRMSAYGVKAQIVYWHLYVPQAKAKGG